MPNLLVPLFFLRHTLADLHRCGIHHQLQQPGGFRNDKVVIRVHQLHGACLHCLGTLGGVAHHQHGLALTRVPFPNAATVGKYKGGLTHEIHEGEVLQGFYKICFVVRIEGRS